MSASIRRSCERRSRAWHARPAYDRPPVVGGGDQAQEQVASMSALPVVEPVVQVLRRLGHGVTDPSGASVSLDSERGALTQLPGPAQGVRQQWQGAGLSIDLAHQQVHQPGLQS